MCWGQEGEKSGFPTHAMCPCPRPLTCFTTVMRPPESRSPETSGHLVLCSASGLGNWSELDHVVLGTHFADEGTESREVRRLTLNSHHGHKTFEGSEPAFPPADPRVGVSAHFVLA